MPVALECFCAGSEHEVFELYSLTFKVSLVWTLGGTMGANVYVNLIDGTDDYVMNVGAMAGTFSPSGSEERDVVIPLDRSGNYDAFYVQLRAEQTAGHSFDGPANYRATWSILQRYRHVDTGTGEVSYLDVISHTIGGGEDVCLTDTGLVTIQVVVGTAGGSVLYMRSSPFISECWTELVNSGQFLPTLLPTFVDATAGGSICLCASGGVEPYNYGIYSGWLPCGQKLNAETGCIEGESDGSCQGSDTVVYQVVDAAGNIATKECGMAWPCPGANVDPGASGPGNVLN